MTSYTLAIDFGTTWTAAAVHSDNTVTRLDFAGETRLPSLIWIDDDGNPLVGQEALHQWAMAPERLLAEPKAHLGQLESIMVGGHRQKVSELVGAVLARVVREARERQGDDPTEVRLTHPARWGERRKQALIEAAHSAGISDPKLISEPEAAALWLANKLEEGERLAVYDLGGGTFDTAVLERTSEGFVVRGEPGGDEHLGGERFDDRLLGHVGSQISPEHPEAWEHLQNRDSSGWAKRAADLRADVRQAKESLSHAESSYISVPVGLEEQPLLIKRSELEELIDEDTRRSYDLLDATIARAELEPGDLEGIYLTGGSSQLRLVRGLGQERYPNLQIRDDPKSVVALGAAGAQTLAEAKTVIEELPDVRDEREQEPAERQKPQIRPRRQTAESAPRGLSLRVGRAYALYGRILALIGALLVPVGLSLHYTGNGYLNRFTESSYFLNSNASGWELFHRADVMAMILASLVVVMVLPSFAKPSLRWPLLGVGTAALLLLGQIVPYDLFWRPPFSSGAGLYVLLLASLAMLSGAVLAWLAYPAPRAADSKEGRQASGARATVGLVMAALGSAAVIAGLFLDYHSSSTAWERLTRLDVTLAVFSFVGPALLLVSTRRRSAAPAIIAGGAACFLLSHLLRPDLNVEPVKVGFLLLVSGTLAAAVGAAMALPASVFGTVIAPEGEKRTGEELAPGRISLRVGPAYTLYGRILAMVGALLVLAGLSLDYVPGDDFGREGVRGWDYFERADILAVVLGTLVVVFVLWSFAKPALRWLLLGVGAAGLVLLGQTMHPDIFGPLPSPISSGRGLYVLVLASLAMITGVVLTALARPGARGGGERDLGDSKEGLGFRGARRTVGLVLAGLGSAAVFPALFLDYYSSGETYSSYGTYSETVRSAWQLFSRLDVALAVFSAGSLALLIASLRTRSVVPIILVGGIGVFLLSHVVSPDLRIQGFDQLKIGFYVIVGATLTAFVGAAMALPAISPRSVAAPGDAGVPERDLALPASSR